MLSYGNVELDKTDDQKLIIFVKQGFEKAFSVLLLRYTPLLKKITPKYTGIADYDDLMQEAIIAFYFAIKSYDSKEGSFPSFAALCVERALLSLCRTFYKKNKITFSDFDNNNAVAPITPETIYIQKEENFDLIKKIENTLSDFEFSVLLNYYHYNSYDEVSHILAVSPKAVDNALLRARKKIKNIKNLI